MISTAPLLRSIARTRLFYWLSKACSAVSVLLIVHMSSNMGALGSRELRSRCGTTQNSDKSTLAYKIPQYEKGSCLYGEREWTNLVHNPTLKTITIGKKGKYGYRCSPPEETGGSPTSHRGPHPASLVAGRASGATWYHSGQCQSLGMWHYQAISLFPTKVM